MDIGKVPYIINGLKLLVTPETFRLLQNGMAQVSFDNAGRVVGVIRNVATGQILEHASLPPISSLNPVLGVAHLAVQGAKIGLEHHHFKIIEAQLSSLQSMLTANVGISLINFLATVGLFFYIRKKSEEILNSLSELSKEMDKLHGKMDFLLDIKISEIISSIKLIKEYLKPDKLLLFYNKNLDKDLKKTVEVINNMHDTLSQRLYDKRHEPHSLELFLSYMTTWHKLWVEINVLYMKFNTFEKKDKEVFRQIDKCLETTFKLQKIVNTLGAFYFLDYTSNNLYTSISKFSDILNMTKQLFTFIKRELYIYKFHDVTKPLIQHQIEFAYKYVKNVEATGDYNSIALVSLESPKFLLNLPLDLHRLTIPELLPPDTEI